MKAYAEDNLNIMQTNENKLHIGLFNDNNKNEIKLSNDMDIETPIQELKHQNLSYNDSHGKEQETNNLSRISKIGSDHIYASFGTNKLRDIELRFMNKEPNYIVSLFHTCHEKSKNKYLKDRIFKKYKKNYLTKKLKIMFTMNNRPPEWIDDIQHIWIHDIYFIKNSNRVTIPLTAIRTKRIFRNFGVK